MQTNDFSNLSNSSSIKTLGEVCVSTNSNITLKHTRQKGISLKESALELKLVSESDYDKFVVPKNMIHPLDKK